MAAVSDSSTVFMLSMDGRREAFVVTNSEVTLGEMQKQVLALFEKTPETWVSLIMESVTYTLPESQPLLLAEDGDVLETVFYSNRTPNSVELNFRMEEQAVLMVVERTMALRDVQETLCRAFRQRFPLMCASVVCAGTSFDEFNDMPFVGAEEGDEIPVSFSTTSDMYFFDKIFRRGAQRPSSDPFGFLDDSLE